MCCRVKAANCQLRYPDALPEKCATIHAVNGDSICSTFLLQRSWCKLEDLHKETTPLNSSNTEKMMVFPSSTASFSSLNFKPAAPNFDDEVCKHFHHIVLTCIPSTKQINSINNGRTNNTNRCLYFVFTIEDVGIWPKFWYLQNAEWMS